jgi:hypothetical protein
MDPCVKNVNSIVQTIAPIHMRRVSLQSMILKERRQV